MQGHRLLALGVIYMVLVLFSACGPSTNPPPPQWTVENQGAPRVEAKKAMQTAATDKSRERSSDSSLEAFRKGESTATPPSSPLKEVYFGFDRSDLQPNARETLQGNAAWLKANPSVRVQVEGHCDERGTQEYNLALGAKRAQAAKDYLVTLGIPSDRLSMISYGEEVPVCTDKGENCWQRNRRARFVIVSGRPTS